MSEYPRVPEPSVEMMYLRPAYLRVLLFIAARIRSDCRILCGQDSVRVYLQLNPGDCHLAGKVRDNRGNFVRAFNTFPNALETRRPLSSFENLST